MRKLPMIAALAALTLATASRTLLAADVVLPARFSFSPSGEPAERRSISLPMPRFTPAASGWGFDQGTKQNAAGSPFAFSVGVPEGNYKVTVTFGGARRRQPHRQS